MIMSMRIKEININPEQRLGNWGGYFFRTWSSLLILVASSTRAVPVETNPVSIFLQIQELRWKK